MHEPFQRVKEIFLKALDQTDATQREGFIRQGCGGDQELAKQVMTLLARHNEAGSFLEPPAAPDKRAIEVEEETASEPRPPIADGDELGRLIGPYKLLQKIGEGGMGVVYMA